LEITRRKLDVAETYVGLSSQVPISQAPVGETTGIDVPGQLWDSFHSRKSDIPNLLPDGIELGVSMMGEATDGTFTYFVGGVALFENTQRIRAQLLQEMLQDYNEGRSKRYYCIAATVLEIEELQGALHEARSGSKGGSEGKIKTALHGVG